MRARREPCRGHLFLRTRPRIGTLLLALTKCLIFNFI
jgi:hypothetical protein